jgi:hypothetical protein
VMMVLLVPILTVVEAASGIRALVLRGRSTHPGSAG